MSKTVFDRIREEGAKLGETSDDTTLRLVFARLDRLESEYELLKMKLKECEKNKEK